MLVRRNTIFEEEGTTISKIAIPAARRSGDCDGGKTTYFSSCSRRDDSGGDGDGGGNSDSDGNGDGDSEDKDGDADVKGFFGWIHIIIS